MTIFIDNRTDFLIDDNTQAMFEKVALASLEYEGFDTKTEVSLSIVDNDEIQTINNQFRKINKPTDVLSFPLLTFEEDEVIEKNENDEVMLGDIIISIDRAKEQALDFGHSLERELAFLTVHSMLHLMGYDHMEEEEERDMIARQKEILDKVGISR